jgi:hypothetical protein
MMKKYLCGKKIKMYIKNDEDVEYGEDVKDDIMSGEKS